MRSCETMARPVVMLLLFPGDTPERECAQGEYCLIFSNSHHNDKFTTQAFFYEKSEIIQRLEIEKDKFLDENIQIGMS